MANIASVAAATQRSPRRAAISIVSVGEPGEDIEEMWIRRLLAFDDIGEQLRIGQFQKRLEGLLFFLRGASVTPFEVTLQQNIELTHAATAAPSQPRHIARCAHLLLTGRFVPRPR